MKALIFAFAILLTGCVGPEHYYGSYKVSCAEGNPATVPGEVSRIANSVSSKLDRPLTLISSGQGPGSLSFLIGAPPSPSIGFSYDALSPMGFSISVVAPNPVEDSATHDTREAVESVLKSSGCAVWHYQISHSSLAGG